MNVHLHLGRSHDPELHKQINLQLQCLTSHVTCLHAVHTPQHPKLISILFTQSQDNAKRNLVCDHSGRACKRPQWLLASYLPPLMIEQNEKNIDFKCTEIKQKQLFEQQLKNGKISFIKQDQPVRFFFFSFFFSKSLFLFPVSPCRFTNIKALIRSADPYIKMSSLNPLPVHLLFMH